MDIEVPLLQTYVDGLDRALGGGIPRGSTVLVAGTPGTMKTSLIAEQPFGSTRLAQWGEDFLADGILNLRQVEVGETDVQLRLRCIKMRWMNHDHNALALNHDGQKFFVTHVISKKK